MNENNLCLPRRTNRTVACEPDHRCLSSPPRERPLEIATARFRVRGLRGTTTALLAQGAGIPEPVLYAHFATKDRLFRETVERNTNNRLRTLDQQLAQAASYSWVETIEKLAEITVAAYVSNGDNTLLTNWALLEAPEYASDLHRREAGCIRLMWECELTRRFPNSGAVSTFKPRSLPYVIQACLANGFWLASPRHTPLSAAPIVHDFAAAVAQLASALIASESED